MTKKILFVVGAALLLSGCTIKLPATPLTGGGAASVWRSADGGDTFDPKVKVEEKRTIASADILSLSIHPTNSNIIYIGTLSSGLFRTRDGGEVWEPIVFPPTKNYGLAVDRTNGDRIYATGVYEDVGKVYRSDDAGANWKEVYTEPGKGTVITSLAIHPTMPNILYAGTSGGVVIKSLDGGETWRNAVAAKGPVTQIFFDRQTPDIVLLVVFEQGTMTSRDRGATWSDNTSKFQTATPGDTKVKPQGILSVAEDPSFSGVFYGSAKNGLFRTSDYGQNWQSVDIIESSKNFPIRAIAVNPKNSNEISYASGQAFYKSNDGGVKWATSQLSTNRGVSVIAYDPENPGIIYLTVRKF